METQSRLIALVGLSLLLVGCSSSVELDPEPESPPVAVEEPAELKPPAERVRADETVRKGDHPRAYQSAIGAAYGSAKARIESIPAQQAITLYHASTGDYPKSHEEFIEKVWKPLQTPLPEVEEGYELRYDPEDHQLWKVPIEAADETAEE